MSGILNGVTLVLAIPAAAAALLGVLPGYRLSARLNMLASLLTFLAALSPGRFDCLITDLHLPGISGVELQQKLKALGSPIPVIVYIDPYSASVIRVQDLFAESRGYYLVRLNRAIHTGDLWGTPGHVAMSLSSVALGFMVISGLIIWRGRSGKKLPG